MGGGRAEGLGRLQVTLPDAPALTRKTLLHTLHLATFPANESSTRNASPQLGQLNWIMRHRPLQKGTLHRPLVRLQLPSIHRIPTPTRVQIRNQTGVGTILAGDQRLGHRSPEKKESCPIFIAMAYATWLVFCGLRVASLPGRPSSRLLCRCRANRLPAGARPAGSARCC